MKPPRSTLRTMLIAIAVIAAAFGWLRYQSQRGWTQAKLERLIEKEFDPTWDKEHLLLWAADYGFHGGEGLNGYEHRYYDGPENRQIGQILFISVLPEDEANLGLFQKGSITAYFYYDTDGKYLSRSFVPYLVL
jgi:hypothetical protein